MKRESVLLHAILGQLDEATELALQVGTRPRPVPIIFYHTVSFGCIEPISHKAYVLDYTKLHGTHDMRSNGKII